MKIFMIAVCFSMVSLFFAGTIVNAINEADSQPLKKKTGLHKPVKSGPKVFHSVNPLGTPHIDREGRVYYTTSVSAKKKHSSQKRETVPPSILRKKKRCV